MPKCPSPCFYELVLLENRGKYKCARCGKLWKQKDIDLAEFIRQNKREREEDREQLKRKAKQAYQAKKAIPKVIEDIKNPKPLKTKEEYYEENRDKIIQQKKEYRKGLSEQAKKEQNEKRKARRYMNIEYTRIQCRINYWKQQQKALALKTFSDGFYTPYSVGLQDSLPTFQHSYLLGDQ